MKEISQLRFSLSVEYETTRNNLNRDADIHILHTLYIYITEDNNIINSLTEARNDFYKNIQVCTKYGDRSIPGRITANKGRREEFVAAPVVYYLVHLSIQSN
jgi:hypothetical protein